MIAAMALVLGCQTPAAPPPPLPPAYRPPPPPPPEPERPRELVRHAPSMKSHAQRVAVQLLGKGLLGFTVAPDGQSQLWLRGWGGTVRLASGGRLDLPRRHYVWSEFAPSGAYLAVADEKRHVDIVALPGGRRVLRVDRAENPRWLTGDVLVFRQGCDGWRVRPGGSPQWIGRAPEPCGELVHASVDYGQWVLAEPGAYRRGVLQTYRSLRRVVLASGRVEVLFASGDDEAVMAPRAAPDGSRVCWLDAGLALQCRDADGAVEQVAAQATTPIEFDDGGRRLLYATGDRASGQVAVVDFDSRRVVELPRAGRQWWDFLPGGQRIAGHGGASSGLVYDLAAGWGADVGDPGSEWEGLWVFPGDPGRLVMGRERRGTRDLYVAILPD